MRNAGNQHTIKQTIGSLCNEPQPEHDNEEVFNHARQLLLNDELFLNSTLCCCYLVKIKMESFSQNSYSLKKELQRVRGRYFDTEAEANVSKGIGAFQNHTKEDNQLIQALSPKP